MAFKEFTGQLDEEFEAPKFVEFTGKLDGEVESEPPEATVSGEIAKGFGRYVSSYETGLDTLTGDTEAAVRAGMQRQEDLVKEYGQARGLEEFKQAYGEGNYLAAGKELLSQVPTALGGQAATLASMAAMGKAGSMIGTAVLPGVGTVAGGTIGAGLGAILSQIMPFYEENLAAQLRAQEERGEPVDLDRAKAGATAVLQASTEVGGAVLSFGKKIIGGIIGAKVGDEAKEALVAAANRSLLAASARGAGRAVATELPVELAQGILTRAQAGEDLTSDEAFEDYKNTIYETIKVAGPLGAGAGPLNRISARGKLDRQAQLEQLKTQSEDTDTTQAPAGATLTPEEQAALDAELTPATVRTVVPEDEIDGTDQIPGVTSTAVDPELTAMEAEYAQREQDIVTGPKGAVPARIKKNAELKQKIDVKKVELAAKVTSTAITQGEQDGASASIVAGTGVSPTVSGQPGGVPATGVGGVDGTGVAIAGDTSGQVKVGTGAEPGAVTPSVIKPPAPVLNPEDQGRLEMAQREAAEAQEELDALARLGFTTSEQNYGVEAAQKKLTASQEIINELAPAPVKTKVIEPPAPASTTATEALPKSKIGRPIKYVSGYTPTPEPSASNFLNQNGLYAQKAPLTEEKGVYAAAADQAFDMLDSVDTTKVNNILRRLAAAENKARGTKTFTPERPLEFMSFDNLLDLYRENIGSRKNFVSGGDARLQAAANRAAFTESLTPEQRAIYDAELNRMFALTLKGEETGRRETTESDLRKQRVKQEKQTKKQKTKAVADVEQQVAEAAKTDEQVETEERAEAAQFITEQEAETETGAVKEATKEAKEKPLSLVEKRTLSAINESGDIKSVLEEISKNNETNVGAVARSLIKILKNLGITDPTARRISFGKVPDGNDGMFVPTKNRIILSGVDGKYTGKRDLAEVILHEILHYYTDHVVDNRTSYINSLDPEDRPEAKAAINRLNLNYQRSKTALGKEFNIPTIKEFIAEAFSNPKFQTALERLDTEGKQYKAATKNSMFKQFVKNVMSALGLSPTDMNVTLKETLEDVMQIISAPSPSEGMIGRSVSYSAAQKTPTVKKAPTGAYAATLSLDNIPSEYAIEKTAGVGRKKGFFEGGLQGVIRRYQNVKQPINKVEDALVNAGLAVYEGNNINTLNTAYTTASGKSVLLAKEQVTPFVERIRMGVAGLVDKTKWTANETLEKLHMIMVALHEPERRMVKYLLNVPLNNDGRYMLTQGGKDITPANRRDQIVKILETRSLTKAQAQQLRAELEDIVNKYKDSLGYSPLREKSESSKPIVGPISTDMDNEQYVVTGMNPQSAAAITQEYGAFAPEVKQLIDSILDSTRALNKATRNLNKESGFWSKPVDNFANFYGWDNYVPLKTSLTQEERLNFDSKRLGGDLQDSTQGFDGSFDVSDNPLLRTMSDSFRAAARAGRKDYTLAVKNNVLQKHIDGKVENIKFEDRNTDLPLAKKQNTVFHYNDDGSVDVITIKDPVMLNAIRRMYKDRQPLVEMMNHVTSFLGQVHTRYNYAFAPMNFVRDILTNAFVIGADMSPAEAAKFIGAVSAKVSQNGLMKAARIAYLFEQNNVGEIKRLLNDKNADPFVRQIAEYLSNGGMISYTESLSLKSRFEQLSKDVGQPGVKDKLITTKEQLDKFADIWNNMFELTSRAAAYGVVKQRFINKDGMASTAAQKRAAAYVKNLANFELSGEYGRVMGALFMFFRPAATGAVRAIEAVAPAFQSLNSAVAALPPSIRNNPAALAKFTASFNKRKTNARIMVTTLMSAGYGMYMMSALMAPEDDLDRNSVLNDNMNQWSRYARFHIPNYISEKYLGGAKDVVFQIPWGFGLGAFAAAGAQVAGAIHGQSTTKEMLKNVFTNIALDSFVPIPVSRMDFEESPLNFVIDSMVPSFARPVVQFALNKDGIGRGIYNESYRRQVDAYTGGDRIPEIWKDASRYIIEATNGAMDISPNSLYFLTNSYVDGFSRILETGYGFKSLNDGEKGFNPKTDSVLFSSFFGAKGNIDSREFARLQQDMLKKQNILNGFKESNPEQYMKYIEKNPMDQPLVNAFNKLVNGDLRKLQTQAKMIRSAPTDMMTPKDRKDMLEPNLLMQRLIKRNILDMYEAYNGKG